MTIKEKIKNYIENEKTKRMPIEDKIEYLHYIKESGIDLDSIDENYVSKEKVHVNNVILNLYGLYSQSALSIRQIMECEDLGMKFEHANNIDDKIKFLQKAISEHINLSDIIEENNLHNNKLIFKYICDIREENEKKKLTPEQLSICTFELKILIPEKEMKKKVMSIIKESALKNLLVSNEIKEAI